jgi:hypothetical protein
MPRQCNFQLNPAILRTCRELYKEGIEVLYNNTIACEVWCDREVRGVDNPYLSAFLRPDWNLNDDHHPSAKYGQWSYDTAYLLENMSRLDVVVRAAADDECYTIRQVVRKFAKGTRKLAQPSHVNIRLELPELPGIPSVFNRGAAVVDISVLLSIARRQQRPSCGPFRCSAWAEKYHNRRRIGRNGHGNGNGDDWQFEVCRYDGNTGLSRRIRPQISQFQPLQKFVSKLSGI